LRLDLAIFSARFFEDVVQGVLCLFYLFVLFLQVFTCLLFARFTRFIPSSRSLSLASSLPLVLSPSRSHTHTHTRSYHGKIIAVKQLPDCISDFRTKEPLFLPLFLRRTKDAECRTKSTFFSSNRLNKKPSHEDFVTDGVE
jgi:hypothetical protein